MGKLIIASARFRHKNNKLKFVSCEKDTNFEAKEPYLRKLLSSYAKDKQKLLDDFFSK